MLNHGGTWMPEKTQFPGASLARTARIRFGAAVALVALVACQAAAPAYADTTGGGTIHPLCGSKVSFFFQRNIGVNKKNVVERTTFMGSCRKGHEQVTYNITRITGTGITFTVGGVDKQGRSICKSPDKGGSPITLGMYPVDFIGKPPAPKFKLQQFDFSSGKFVDVTQRNGKPLKSISDCGLYRYVPAGTGGS
jgi:hypothetical protein